MKTNKKLYNFKVVHKRKKRVRSTIKWWKTGNSTYTKDMRRAYRVKEKAVLYQIRNGKELEFPLYKKTMWWDA